jgi:hypothetical protein
MSKLKTYNVEIDVNDTAHSDKIAPPPKKWRNRFKCVEGFYCKFEKRDFREGQLVRGRNLWPSKDIAETAVARVSDLNNPIVWGGVVYLGAEPEE